MNIDNQPIRNKIAESGIVNLDLGSLIPAKKELVFDLGDFLYEGFILKEKDFRKSLSEHNWEPYQDAYVMIQCSADAIIPQWAFMLVASYLDKAFVVVSGDRNALYRRLWDLAMASLREDDWTHAKVMVKGCTHLPEMEYAYLALVRRLQPWVQTLMYGEVCSAVPVFKRRKA